jgi:beta-phosphoglucomutase-like phosphatase (HAD superfamily)
MTPQQFFDLDGIVVDDGSPNSEPLLAQGWLKAWSDLGGGVSLSATRARLFTWIQFGRARSAPENAARLMNELLDTPGLPGAIRAVITQRNA